MNDRAEAVLDDDQVIARLRRALDELTAPADDLIAVRTLPTRRTSPVLIATSAAACLAMIGIAVWMLGRRDAGPVAAPPLPASTTIAASTPTITPPSSADALRFALIAADLVAERTVPIMEGTLEWTAAWTRRGDDGEQVFTLKVYPAGAWLGSASATVVPAPDGTARELVFQSVGLTDAERATLAGQVVAGSGLPWVLPNSDWTYAGGNSVGWAGAGEGAAGEGAAGEGAGSALSQVYRGSDDTRVVRLQEGGFSLQFEGMLGATQVSRIEVTGRQGWVAVLPDGSRYVVWTTDGLWVSMTISPSLAERTDGLLAAVTDRRLAAPATPVPAPSAEP